MKITVEFLTNHTSLDCKVGRIPCLGEMVCVGDSRYEVRGVMHMIDTRESEPQAIVRVR